MSPDPPQTLRHLFDAGKRLLHALEFFRRRSRLTSPRKPRPRYSFLKTNRHCLGAKKTTDTE